VGSTRRGASGAGPAPEPAGPDTPDDPETLESPGDPEEVARIVCLRMLDRRAYSRAELRTALRRRGVPDDAADRVLDRFTAIGLIDDAALAEGYASAQHRTRGLSARAVAVKLRRRGIPDDTAAAAVAQIDRHSEQEAARAVVTRRLRSMSGLDPAVQARRLVGTLARKGYPPGVASEAVREALREARSADSGWPDILDDPAD
jgi:regulatory protein